MKINHDLLTVIRGIKSENRSLVLTVLHHALHGLGCHFFQCLAERNYPANLPAFSLLFAGVLVYGKRVLPGIVLGTIGTALLGGATLSEALLSIYN